MDYSHNLSDTETQSTGGTEEMAKIVRFHQLGGPEVLKIEEVPTQEPKKGEVRLRVQAIGLNRAESMFMHGYYLEPTQLPASLGYEASGVVVGVADLPNPAVKLQVMKITTIVRFGGAALVMGALC